MNMETPSVTPISEPDGPIASSEPKIIDHAKIARMHILQGKPFLECAMAGGYTEASARKGIRYLMSESLPLSDAIRRCWESSAIDVTRLKPVAVSRLYREIAAPDSPNAMKAIELAGRFRETDWFVRSAEVQMGILVNISENIPATEPLDTFKE
jgi:hypothetical protein